MIVTDQLSFIAGELAPSLHARVDLAKSQTGLVTCRNFFVHFHGGVSNRSGLQFIAELKDSTKKGRLIPFSFNTTQTYILQFENLTMRVIKDSGQVLLGAGPTIFEVATPYIVADLPNLKFAQSADVLTITHPSYQPRDLTRTDHDAWTFTVVDFTPDTPLVSSIGAASLNFGVNISAATQANPVVITATAHGFANGDEVFTNVVGGMVELNKRRFIAANITVNTLELKGEDGTSYSSFTGGGKVGKFLYQHKITAISSATLEEGLGFLDPTSVLNVELSSTDVIDLTWAAATGASEYKIYRGENGVFGLIGTSKELYFKDKNQIADFTNSPPEGANPFETANNYPSAFTYHQQRKLFANTNNNPQEIFGTRTGDFKSMDVSFPVKDDDAISFVLNASQVNEIRHLVSAGFLLVLTSGSEWVISGGSDSTPITPSSINADQKSFEGVSHVPPIVVGQTVLFVQDKGSIVREINIASDVAGFSGKNLSILATHLFRGKTIVSWTYAKVPDSVVWAVLDDGTLLGLTYIQEQDVWGWHRHDTDGDFESVASVSEGSEDAVYFIVKRTIGGVTKRYVERMKSRVLTDVRDSFFVDSGLSLDVPLTITSVTNANPVVVTATAHGFANLDLVDISNVKGMTEINNNRYKITNATTNTFELTDQYTGVNVDGTGFTTYSSDGNARKTVTIISGLTHLEGKTVAICADGNDHPQKVVVSGSITLDHASSRVHVGLPYVSDLETLNVNFQDNPIVQDKEKNVSKVTMQFEKSRFPFVGSNSTLLTEMKQRDTENWNKPTALFTGTREIIITPEWNKGGKVFVRHSTPLPLSILSIIPEVTIGDQ